ncbi:MAG: transposase [Hyphomonadaceae bacterium]|nr:transposase [Clostridia bacterium]
MDYNSNIHHRRSIRLKHYDYTTNGYYFVTICTENKENLFGDIIDGKMLLSHAGNMVEERYLNLKNMFEDIELVQYIVMPNHFHAIIALVGAGFMSAHDEVSSNPKRADTRPAPTMGDVICAFKSMTTNAYIKGVRSGIYSPFQKHIWQRNYYEHVIRDKNEFLNTWEYIASNALKWCEDEYYV